MVYPPHHRERVSGQSGNYLNPTRFSACDTHSIDQINLKYTPTSATVVRTGPGSGQGKPLYEDQTQIQGRDLREGRAMRAETKTQFYLCPVGVWVSEPAPLSDDS